MTGGEAVAQRVGAPSGFECLAPACGGVAQEGHGAPFAVRLDADQGHAAVRVHGKDGRGGLRATDQVRPVERGHGVQDAVVQCAVGGQLEDRVRTGLLRNDREERGVVVALAHLCHVHRDQLLPDRLVVAPRIEARVPTHHAEAAPAFRHQLDRPTQLVLGEDGPVDVAADDHIVAKQLFAAVGVAAAGVAGPVELAADGPLLVHDQRQHLDVADLLQGVLHELVFVDAPGAVARQCALHVEDAPFAFTDLDVELVAVVTVGDLVRELGERERVPAPRVCHIDDHVDRAHALFRDEGDTHRLGAVRSGQPELTAPTLNAPTVDVCPDREACSRRRLAFHEAGLDRHVGEGDLVADRAD